MSMTKSMMIGKQKDTMIKSNEEWVMWIRSRQSRNQPTKFYFLFFITQHEWNANPRCTAIRCLDKPEYGSPLVVCRLRSYTCRKQASSLCVTLFFSPVVV